MNIRFVFFLVLLLNSLAVVVALMIYSDTGINNFNEGGFITQLSVFQLLMISWLSYKVFKARSVTRKGSFWRDSSVVWWVISLGFLYLAADELYEFHERIDRQIHNVFNLQQTGFTDRIDDLLVGLYGLVGIGVLIIYRNEWKIYKEARLFLICGFFLFFAMVQLDVLTNRKDILTLFFDMERAKFLNGLLRIIEDVFKVFSEGFFLLAFYLIWLKTKVHGCMSSNV